MSNIFILLFMIFCHVIDDYFIQSAGCLSFLKQYDWWKENEPADKYRNDYKIGLLAHGFSWSFMVMIPIFISYNFDISISMGIVFCCNWFIHSYVDHMKANCRWINLITDQFIHMIQILILFMLYII